MPTLYERLVELKLNILRGCIHCPESGICLNAFCHEFSAEHCKDWPDFSGSRMFPVPHPVLHPKIAYYTSRRLKNQFDLPTEYGRNRMRYLDFLIHRAKLLGV